MRSLPTILNDELLKEAYFYCHLVEMYLTSTHRFTSLDIDVVYNGNTYYSRGLKLGNAGFSMTPQVDSMSFDIDNVDQYFTSLILNEEIRKKKCTIRMAALDSNAKVIAETVHFTGLIDQDDWDEKKATIEIASPFIMWRKTVPRRTSSPNCPWVFKDTDCNYAGAETWCNQTYNRCTALSNTANFGGSRWLPGLMNKKIWWGRESSI